MRKSLVLLLALWLGHPLLASAQERTIQLETEKPAPNEARLRAETYFQTGQIFAEKKLFKDAIEAYQKAIQADPSFEKAYISLALVYSLQKKYPLAVQELDKALKARPNAYLPYKVLGKIYLDLDKPQEALYAFEQYLKQIPPVKLKPDEKQEIEALLYQLQNRLKQETPKESP